MEKIKILVVDDEAIIRRMLSRVLIDEGYLVDVADNGAEALDMIKVNRYNLVISDLKMPDIGGLELLEKCKTINPYMEFIIITGFPTAEVAVEVMKLGAADFICKPFDLDKFLEAVEKCLLKQELENDSLAEGELEIFLKVVKLIYSEDNLNNMMGSILECALRLTKTLRGCILVFKDSCKCLAPIAMRGLDHGISKGLEITFEEGLLAELNNNGLDKPLPVELKGRIKEQVNAKIGLKGKVGDVFLRSQSMTGLGAGILGVIIINGKASSADISDRDLRLLRILAAKLAIAFENKKLHYKINELKE